MLKYAAVVALVTLGLGSGCCPRTKPPITITKINRSCTEELQLKPQQPPRVDWAECEGWETCLDGENTDRLALWIEKALAYQAAVDAECGPKPAKGDPK